MHFITGQLRFRIGFHKVKALKKVMIPDFVNVEAGTDDLAKGDMWFAKKRTGQYIPDDRSDKRLLSYDDLFIAWQQNLQFIIQGKDADES